MDKESIIELQKIDCNCNDCVYMIRDAGKFNRWANFQKELQYKEFIEKKEAALFHAYTMRDNTMINKAKKMKFQFDRSWLINYGDCNKFGNSVSFIPNAFQFETQDCFEHRRNNL